MKKISLNFFGEKAEINMPTNMESLRKQYPISFSFHQEMQQNLLFSMFMIWVVK